MSETAAKELVPMLEYQQARPHLFPSEQSMRWYVRQHRAALVEADALVMVARRYLVVPSAIDAFVLRGGKATAQRVAA
jgi:hypothetical protein